MRSRGTDSADKISVAALTIVYPILTLTSVANSLHSPQPAAQIVYACLPDGKPDPSKAGLPERRKPALARHEAADVPPAAEEPEEGTEGPGRAASVGVWLAFAEDQSAILAQHRAQMAERR